MQRLLLLFGRVLIPVLLSLSAVAQSKQLGDYQLTYGYSFFTPSVRSTQNGGSDTTQKLPGQFKFWFNDAIDMFARSDTFKASKNGQSWKKGAGDTFVGLDLVLRSEAKRMPEFDFTYDAKLPTASGFTAGEVDHEAILSLLKTIDRHSFEGDFGDYIEGLARQAAAHSFEMTLSDEIGLGRSAESGFKWTTVQELDFTSASPDTPTEVYEVAKLKYYVNAKWSIAPGVRVTYTPYSGRFSAFISVTYNGRLRKR